MPPEKSSRQAQQLIRASLMAGVLMFGAVMFVVHRRPTWQPMALPPIAGYALVSVAILAVSIVMMLKGRVAREPDPDRRAGLRVIGWSLGEGAALLGGVLFFYDGQAQWYGLGVLAMMCTVVLLPLDPRSAAESVDAAA